MAKPYEPSEKMIKKLTAKIREGWDERTFRLRSGLNAKEADKIMQWTPPVAKIEDERLLGIIAEDDDIQARL